MVVTGVQRVPEEHDLRREVQTLQVMGEGELVLVLYNGPVTSFLVSCHIRVEELPLTHWSQCHWACQVLTTP